MIVKLKGDSVVMATESTLIKEYCLANEGGVFDISYITPKVFPNISNDNIRQVCRRLTKNGLLKHISKGFYLIGESELSDEERLTNYFLYEGKVRVGMFTGESLFYELGLIDKKPEIITMRSSKVNKEERIGNIIVEKARTPYASGDLKTYELSILMELLLNEHLANSSNLTKYTKLRDSLADSYSDKIAALLWGDFHRMAYIKLAFFLNDMDISNQAEKIGVEGPWNLLI